MARNGKIHVLVLYLTAYIDTAVLLLYAEHRREGKNYEEEEELKKSF